jgi:antitoxin (DNA-binding transcriptional repressor) of toxin-antitoxin stability system
MDMTTVSIAELRQNPAPALAEVERGKLLTITRYRKPIATITPLARSKVSGIDVMKALALCPVDEQWSEELEALRSQDRAIDPWDEA